MKKLLLLCAISATSALSLAQVDPSRVIVTVDGVDIKGAEYYHRMEYLPNVGRLVGDSFQPFFPGFMTLEQLINERLIFEMSKQKGVYPTDAEVQDELNYRTQLDATYKDKYLASGRTMQDLLYDLKFELAQLNLLTAGITVTDQEVEQFYKENHPMFTTPQQYRLRLIAVTSKADADAVDKELAAGKPFDQVAKAHSVDRTSAIGGDVGLTSGDDFPEDIRKSLAATPAGKVTPWFVGAKENQFRFQVTDVVPEKLQELTPMVRRQARLRMRMDRGRVKNNIKKDLDELRRKANIDIKDKNLADAYKQYINAYLKATGG